jgi:hypothetical protein
MIDSYNGVLERGKGERVGNRHVWARFACRVGHELLPVYNRGGMLTWLFTKLAMNGHQDAFRIVAKM